MTLYLARHGDAPNKTLSEKGLQETKQVAETLKHLSITEIHHSSKLRAKQTAAIFSEILDSKPQIIEKPHLNPEDSIDTIYDELQFSDGILIVSHLPFVEKLTARLLGLETFHFNFQTSCVVCIDEGILNWILSPKCFKLG